MLIWALNLFLLGLFVGLAFEAMGGGVQLVVHRTRLPRLQMVGVQIVRVR